MDFHKSFFQFCILIAYTHDLIWRNIETLCINIANQPFRDWLNVNSEHPSDIALYGLLFVVDTRVYYMQDIDDSKLEPYH